MTTLGSNIEPTTTGGEIVSVFILLIGIGFVALLTGSFAQRFLAPEIAEIEEELEEDEPQRRGAGAARTEKRPGAAAGARGRDRANGKRT